MRYEKPQGNIGENPENNFPIGKAKEIPRKDFLPAAEVKNEVLWVNPDFPELPFKIIEGQSSTLGLFLTPGKEMTTTEKRKRFFGGEKTVEVIKELNTKDIEVGAQHGRSGLLGRVIFRDDEGSLYRDIDLKGIGYSLSRGNTGRFPKYVENISVVEGDGPEFPKVAGILELKDAIHERDVSEEFQRAGIRVARVLAVLQLEEVIVGTRKEARGIPEGPEIISVEEAKKRKYLLEKSEPAVIARAYGTKARLWESAGDGVKRQAQEFDAIALVGQELNKREDEFKTYDYADWLIKTVAKSVGLMHKNGWCHGKLDGHNITLDGRLVDFDTVSQPGEDKEKYFEKDFKEMQETLKSFISGLVSSTPTDKINDLRALVLNIESEYKKAMLGNA